MSAVRALQVAVVQAIRGNSDLMNLITDVYDGAAPQGATIIMPYLIIDSWTLVPRDRMNAFGARVTFAIHAWTDYRGTKSAASIETILEDMFHQGTNRVVMPTDSPWSLVTLHRSEVQYLQDGPSCQAIFRITAQLHKTPQN
jgi:hypothetical protein